MISTDLRSLSSDRTRQRRQDINASGRGGGPRKSNDCGNSRRVLFKNNVSVYCFDAESPQAQNCAVSGPSRRPTRENGVRSNVHSHETVTRPPTSTSSHAVFDNRRGRRPAASELDNRHVDRQLISPQRWSDEYVADNSITQSSSTDVVVNFEVTSVRSHIHSQGRSQEFAKGRGTKEEVWGLPSSSGVQGQSPGGRLGAKKPETHAEYSIEQSHRSSQVAYTVQSPTIR